VHLSAKTHHKKPPESTSFFRAGITFSVRQKQLIPLINYTFEETKTKIL